MDKINLHHPIFTSDPDEVFARSMKVPIGFWNDLYQRHKFWGYEQDQMIEWFEFKQHRPISRKTIYRWIIRQELYNDAQRAIKEGSYLVTVSYFSRNQQYVVKYLYEPHREKEK